MRAKTSLFWELAFSTLQQLKTTCFRVQRVVKWSFPPRLCIQSRLDIEHLVGCRLNCGSLSWEDWEVWESLVHLQKVPADGRDTERIVFLWQCSFSSRVLVSSHLQSLLFKPCHILSYPLQELWHFSSLQELQKKHRNPWWLTTLQWFIVLVLGHWSGTQLATITLIISSYVT